MLGHRYLLEGLEADRLERRGANLVCRLRTYDSVSVITNNVVAQRLEWATTCNVGSLGSTVKRDDTAACSGRSKRPPQNSAAECTGST